MEFKNQGQRCPTEAEFTSLFANKVREKERWAVAGMSAPGRHTDPAHWAHHVLAPGIWPSQIRVHFFGGKRADEGREVEIFCPLYLENMFMQIFEHIYSEPEALGFSETCFGNILLGGSQFSPTLAHDSL